MYQNTLFKKRWLLSLILLILLMIVIGGLTRLTNSGLSIVDWRLIMGILPPLSPESWLAVFQKYQQSPEYQLLNSAMTLEQFKSIFFFEYLHRILGRLLGLYTILPFLFLAFKNKNLRQENKKFLILSFLVILQGVLGWFMVKSGLKDIPRISHFRLAIHFAFALIYLSYAFYLYCDYAFESVRQSIKNNAKKYILNFPLWILALTLLILQMIYGAFMAGLDAGYYTSEYPKILNQWLPDLAIPSSWRDTLFSVVFINFFHRHFAIVVSLAIVIWGLTGLRKNSPSYRWFFLSSIVLVFVQMLLGIATVILSMPISFAVLHQLNAALLLQSVLLPWFLYLKFYSFKKTLKSS